MFLIAAGFYPLFCAWRANRRTSLSHAVAWAAAAWVFWGAALMFGSPYQVGWDTARYVALCATGAAGVAVLGARRPQVQAWDLVILGLLAVMLLPVAESVVLGTPAAGGLRLGFLCATLGVSILNYLPTSIGGAALLFGAVVAGECASLGIDSFEFGSEGLVHMALLFMPWLALILWRVFHRNGSSFDGLWRDFRDRYGLFWAQRVRDQYNRGAANAGLPGYLSWHGWKPGEQKTPPTDDQVHAMHALLAALLGRFLEEPQQDVERALIRP